MEACDADPRSLGEPSRDQLPELSGRHLGTRSGRRAASPRRSELVQPGGPAPGVEVNVRSVPDAEWLAGAAAERVASAIEASEGPFDLVLSGGSTPKKLHTRLIERDKLDWSKVRIWFGDERHVPLDHPESNYRMAQETLLSKIKPLAVFPMFRGGSPEEDAAAYEADLIRELGDKPLDLVLLGMGADAHTASLFPGEPSVRVTDRQVVASTGHAGIRERITMTFPRLHRSKETLLLIAGADKKDALKRALRQPYDPDAMPVQAILNGPSDVTLYVDSAADPGA
ncbi:6-phosphogluconolactonase [bacterium]|nr:MAG: 6-phosphogluconolactonase [bacterium]